MGRIPKPWYRKSRGKWLVIIDGVRHDLGPDKDEAFRRFHELMAERPPEPGQGRLTRLKDVFAGYLAHLKRNAKAHTHRVAKFFLDSFPDRPIAGLTFGAVEQWVASHPTWGQATERSAKGTVMAALNWAVTVKLISANPIRGLPVPSMPSRGEETVLSSADFEAILKAISDEPFRLFVIALRLTGARPSEVAKVTAENFNPGAGAWTFAEHKTAKRTGRKRVVLLVPEMIELCGRLAVQNPVGPLFRNTKGVGWTVRAVIKRFHYLQKKVGIRCIAYGFRHSFATALLQAGMPDHDVAALLGHSGTGMLYRHYAHLLNNTQRLRETLSAHLPRPSTPPKEPPKDETGGPPGQAKPDEK